MKQVDRHSTVACCYKNWLLINFFFAVFVLCDQGDDLIHYCKYDTMDREKLVQVRILSKINYNFFFVCVRLDITDTDLNSIKKGSNKCSQLQFEQCGNDLHRCKTIC